MPKTHDGRICRVSRIVLGLFALLAACSTTGCTALQGVNDYLAYNDSVNDFVLDWRNSVWARQAWHERKREFTDQPQFAAFGSGFRAGYVSVASGGNGCPPAIPPRQYWTWKYQTPEGQAQVAAWFTGFPYGAKAGQEDGAGLYQQIQISSEMERQFSPEYARGEVGPEYGQPAAAPGVNEPIAVPPPGPIYDPQSRVGNRWPAMTEPPAPQASLATYVPQPPSSGVVPAAYQEPIRRPAAAAIPPAIPVRTPKIGAAADISGSSWSLSR